MANLPVFDAVTQQSYNVILIRKSPCGGESYYHPIIATAEPIDWERGMKWVRGMSNGFGNQPDWQKDNYVGVYLEPSHYNLDQRGTLYTEMMQLLLMETIREMKVNQLRLIQAMAAPHVRRMAYRHQEMHRDLAHNEGCPTAATVRHQGESYVRGEMSGIEAQGMAVL